MKIANGKPEFCCGDFACFCGTVEYVCRNYLDEDGQLYIIYGVVSGTRDTVFKFCPFCGEKIELIME